MKKIINCLAVLALIAVFTTTTQAQSKESKKSTQTAEDPLLSTDKLWFGTGLDQIGATSNSFFFGVSPTVGYKLTDFFSVGLRVPVNYNYLKLFNNAGEGLNDHKIDIGVGAFSRIKIFRGVFAHAEYNQLFLKQYVINNGTYQIDPANPTKLLKQNLNRNEMNIGLGYSNGGGRFGYEFSVLYNVIEDPNSAFNPWTLRAGVNYNF